MKHLILGTAGHIDHGKTSLVRALTGIDTDRLPEEKARGITIELGFAHLDLPGDIRFGIVDVPGHERFIRTMVAGVGGMDLVMLTIAADEGVMPQTREHLEICRLLGVQRGLVALTKSDLVEPEWLGLVTEEVRDYLGGSFLEDAAIVPVSSRSGAGLDRLRAELARLGGEIEPKRSDGPYRLPVDRVFTVAGFGTVVTGTLLSGTMAVGDEVELLPAGLQSKVRGIQIHGARSETGGAGERLAVNLQGVEHSAVKRGDVVAPLGLFRTTRLVDVRLDYLDSAGKELKNRSLLRFHSSTAEVQAEVVLLAGGTLRPGESCYARLRLAEPLLLLPGDPFVLRRSSPSATLGGGRVLDPFPPRRRRRREESLQLLAAIEGEDDAERLGAMVEGALLTGIAYPELLRRTGFSPGRLDKGLALLLSGGRIIQMTREPRIFLSRGGLAELQEHLLARVGQFMRENPLKNGIGREELKGGLPRRSDQRFFTPLLASLERDGRLLPERDIVRLPVLQRIEDSGRDTLQDRLEALLNAGGCEPPTLKELGDGIGITEKLLLEHLNRLTREGRAVKVKSDIFYPPGAVAEIREKLTSYLKEHGEITPPRFREVTGLSRKFMIPLLEYFDGEKLTIRVGDKRVLRRP
jgi:selenocysteine-specific elongation factor